MVLSMLSTIQNVKPRQVMTSEPPTTKDGKASNLASSDMSRRKQRNPKPCFNSSSSHDDDDRGDDEAGDPNKQEEGENNNQSEVEQDRQGCSPPTHEDLSSIVKVEMLEGPPWPTTTEGPSKPTSACLASPLLPLPQLFPAPPQLVPFPQHRASLISPSLPPPPPPQLALQHADAEKLLMAANIDQMHAVAKKNGLFHFGDVSVEHHPDTKPVPMMVPLAYLYPLPPLPPDNGSKKVRYRMFVPLGGPDGTPVGPFFPPTVSPSKNLQSGAEDDKEDSPRASSGQVRKPIASSNKRDVTTPLDLRKSPTTHEVVTKPDDDRLPHVELLKQRSPAAAAAPAMIHSQETVMKLQQQEIEAQLNFLKARHLELMKSQQAGAKPAKSSRCEECNINFSKHQNYVAHKKYYCAASAAKGSPPAPFQMASDNEDDGDLTGGVRSSSAAKQQRAETPRHGNKQQQQNGHAATTTTSLPSAVSPSTNAAAALNNFIGLAEDAVMNKGALSKEAMAAAAFLEGSSNPHFLLAAVNAAAAAGAPVPTNSSQSNLSHFVCEGCGIKFKSVSNLQAHQARYCAGLRKLVSQDGGGESTNPIEAMVKRLLQQQHHPQGATGNELMAYLNAKSLEQQLQHAVNDDAAGSLKDDYVCKLCGLKEGSMEKLKDHINMHFIGHVKRKHSGEPGSSSAAATRRPETETAADVVPRKRPKLDVSDFNSNKKDASPPPPAPTCDSNSPPPKSTDQAEAAAVERVEGEPTVMKCTACDIGFSQLSNFLAHKKYYCRGLKSNSPPPSPKKSLPSPSHSMKMFKEESSH